MPSQNLETYGQRLASAMAVAGFPVRGGQSKLGRAIGCTSQTVSQAINRNLTLGAVFHVRASIRLGVRPQWLAEGRGQRYDPAGPRVALPGVEPPFAVPDEWLEGFETEQGAHAPPHVSESRHHNLNLAEQALINKLRSSPRLFEAVATVVELAEVSKGA